MSLYLFLFTFFFLFNIRYTAFQDRVKMLSERMRFYREALYILYGNSRMLCTTSALH